MWPFESKKKAETVAFSDILTGLQSAISQVQDMLQTLQLQNLSRFWLPEGKPLSQVVQLGNKKVEVPLLTLVPHTQLAMDEVSIKFTTRVGSIVSKQGASMSNGMEDGFSTFANTSSGLSLADFQVAMDGVKAEGEDTMHVSITFKMKDTPEAVSRLVDEYNKDL